MNTMTCKHLGEEKYITIKLPVLPYEPPEKNPVLAWLDDYTIEELEQDIETGEEKIGERNTWLRSLLNDALQEKGLDPAF